MALGQSVLDRPLTFPQPVHGRVDLVGADPSQTQIGHQAGVAPPPGRAQIGTGAPHDQDQRVAMSRSLHAGPNNSAKPNDLAMTETAARWP